MIITIGEKLKAQKESGSATFPELLMMEPGPEVNMFTPLIFSAKDA